MSGNQVQDPLRSDYKTTSGRPWSEGKKHNGYATVRSFGVSGDMSSIMRVKKTNKMREERSSHQRSLHLRYTSSPAKGSSEGEGKKKLHHSLAKFHLGLLQVMV